MTPQLFEELESTVRDCIDEFNELLHFSQTLMSSIQLQKRVKQKTVLTFNLYSGIFQRSKAVISLVESKQTNAANVILRSTWELLVLHDFVRMDASNKYLDILMALEAKNDEKQWRQIKNLRLKYPNSETWKAQWSDEEIEKRIIISQKRLNRKTKKLQAKNININEYTNLLQKISKLDDLNLIKDPNYKTITQMDYHTVYKLLSEDVHSTIMGTYENTYSFDGGVSIRLDKFDFDSLRCLTTAFNMFMNYIQQMNKRFKTNMFPEIRRFREIEKQQHTKYLKLEKKIKEYRESVRGNN